MAALAASSLAGCATYYSGLRYEPRPMEITTAAPEGAAGAEGVRTLVTIIGVRRAGKAAPQHPQGVPASVEVRLRLENQSNQPARFDPASLQLFTADLTPMHTPIVEPAPAVDLPPGQSATFTAYFPFPADRDADDLDMHGLNLRWTIELAGKPITQSATFTRVEPVRYDSYPRGGIYYGVGYGFGASSLHSYHVLHRRHHHQRLHRHHTQHRHRHCD